MVRYVAIKTFFNEQDAWDWCEKQMRQHGFPEDYNDYDVTEVNFAWRASISWEMEDINEN